MLSVSNLSVQFGKRVLFDEVNTKFLHGNCYGIIGANGAGKSTLIKTITKEIPHLSGNVILHQKIKVGYFEQEQTTLDDDKTIYETIEELMKDETSTMIRKHLAKFLFKREDVFKKVSVLSGGEKVRLLFATFGLKRYDMIILDEPTNHLDVSMIEWLEDYLNKYEGAVLIVTHNELFLESLANRLIVFDDEVRDTLLVKNPEDRSFYTTDQCKLINGKPFSPGDQDDVYENLIKMEQGEGK